jgi:hypothetical protein
MKTTSASVLWSQEWAYERPAQAMRYLAENYPECGALEALDGYQEPVHEAAVVGDRGAYQEALRELMRTGRREALAIRREAA